MQCKLIDVTREVFPIAGTFNISRGAKREAIVVVAHVGRGGCIGRGECVPYVRYGETVDGVIETIREFAARGAFDREQLNRSMSPGAARNALDCALLDCEAKAGGRSVSGVLGLPPVIGPHLTCYTLSLGAPEAMASAAAAAVDKPLLKLKLGGGGLDAQRLAAVRGSRPDARLVADANEAWTEGDLMALLAACKAAGVELIEQPLPAGADDALAHVVRDVPVCADESAHTCSDLAALAGRYDAVNIKLDKAGGLTEAVAMAKTAKELGFRIMVGCMVSTSLAMAPAWQLAGFADWLDLDGPLLLAHDRLPSIGYASGLMHHPPPGLWG